MCEHPIPSRRKMEAKAMNVSPAIAMWIIFGVVLLTCMWKVAAVVWMRPRRLALMLRQQGIAGTPYRLVIGDLMEMSRMTREALELGPKEFSNDTSPILLPFLQQSVEKYGKCCYTWMGPRPVVNVMDGELVKEMLSRVYEFGKPHLEGIADLLVSGLLIYEGNKWAKHRKILSPAFHQEKLKLVVGACSRSCEEMMRKWELLLSPDGSCEVDVLPYADGVTGDILLRAAFGSSYDEGKKIFQLQKVQVDLFFKALGLAYIPGWRFLPTRMNRRMKKIDGEIKTMLQGIIDRRTKAMEAGEVGNEDLLGLPLESNYKEHDGSGHNNKGMSIDEVVQECKLFYLAGQETTAGVIVWALLLLCKHPDWQARAREEIMQVFGDKEIDFNGLSRLKIVNMILQEVLRLYPPAPLMYRTNYQATRLGRYFFPAGVLFFIPILLIHHDPELWGEDALAFNPERFADGVSRASNDRSPLPFLPFSSGPRVCIGQTFALLEAKAIFSMIPRKFSVELSPSYRHAPSVQLTTRPGFGAPMILRKL